MSESKNNPHDVFKINAVIVVLGLMSLLASFCPGWHLWGLDYIKAFPIWLRTLLILLLIVTSLPRISMILGQKLSYIGELPSPKIRLFVFLSFLAVMAGLFIAFSSKNLLLGDGYNLLGNLKAGKTISPLQPLDDLLHRVIYIILGKGDGAGYWSYAICSYIAGVLLFFGISKYTDNKSNLMPALAIPLIFPMIQFYFGYVETYVISSTLALLYLLSAYRDFKKRQVSLTTIVWLILACAFHIYGILMLPSFIYLLWNKFHSRRLIIIYSFILIGLGIPTLLYLGRLADIQLFQALIPLRPTPDNPYYLFSRSHLWDFLNLILLCYPIILIVPFLRRDFKIEQISFYIAALAPAILFTFLFDPTLSAMRDWDLLSIASIPIMMILITTIASYRPDQRIRLNSFIAPLLIFAILHTGGWIWQNTNKINSYSIIKEFVRNDIHYSSDYFHGARNKAWANIITNNYQDNEEAIRAMAQRYYGDPNDTLNVGNIVCRKLIYGDTVSAIQMAHDDWRRFAGNENSPLRDKIIFLLGSTMVNGNKYNEATEIFETYRKNGGRDYDIFMELATAYQKMGNIDSAMSLLNQGYIIRTDAPLSEQLNFYLQASKMKYYLIANSGLRRLYPRIPALYTPAIMEIMEALSSQQYDNANSLISEFWKKYSTSQSGSNKGQATPP